MIGSLRSFILLFAITLASLATAQNNVVNSVQPKMAKIYGAGGIRGLEAYQSGFVISAEGHVLTAFSYVLDTDDIGVTLNDGREFVATMLAADPQLEIAVLKIEAEGLPHFDINDSVDLQPGSRILAFSNLYGIATGNEPTSVLHGIVAAVSKMAGRKGTYNTPYDGSIYVLDAITNNAGAAGGALTDRTGRLAGILGKELKSSETDIWLNYSLPISAVRDSVQAMMDGKSNSVSRAAKDEAELAKNPWTLSDLGMQLMPDLLSKTPPYIESVFADSPVGKSGLRPDDLVMFVGDKLVRSLQDLRNELRKVENADDISITVLRNQQLIPVNISPEFDDK